MGGLVGQQTSSNCAVKEIKTKSYERSSEDWEGDWAQAQAQILMYFYRPKQN